MKHSKRLRKSNKRTDGKHENLNYSEINSKIITKFKKNTAEKIHKLQTNTETQRISDADLLKIKTYADKFSSKLEKRAEGNEEKTQALFSYLFLTENQNDNAKQYQKLWSWGFNTEQLEEIAKKEESEKHKYLEDTTKKLITEFTKDSRRYLKKIRKSIENLEKAENEEANGQGIIINTEEKQNPAPNHNGSQEGVPLTQETQSLRDSEFPYNTFNLSSKMKALLLQSYHKTDHINILTTEQYKNFVALKEQYQNAYNKIKDPKASGMRNEEIGENLKNLNKVYIPKFETEFKKALTEFEEYITVEQHETSDSSTVVNRETQQSSGAVLVAAGAMLAALSAGGMCYLYACCISAPVGAYAALGFVGLIGLSLLVGGICQNIKNRQKFEVVAYSNDSQSVNSSSTIS